MKRILVLLILASMFITACSPKKEEVVKEINDEEASEPIVEETESQEVFTYGKDAQELILELKAEPSLIGDQLVRLVGVVAGRAVVVEVAGRGRLLKVGSDVCGYVVQEIGGDYVVLGKEIK